jgi:O-antigen ligase
MEKHNTVSKVFLGGIVAGGLVFSNQILDPTLTPRIISFSVFALIALFLLYRTKQKINFELDITNGAYFLFTAFCVLSIVWSNTGTEAVFESSKVVLSFTAFSITYYCLKNDPTFFKATLLKFSILICFIVFGFAFYQYSKIKVLDKEALYTITAINGHKNLFASFLFLNLFFLILTALEFKGLWRLLALVAIALTLLALIFIKTKAVWIGLMLVILIFAFLFLTKKIKLRLNFYLSLIICLLLANVFFAIIVPIGIEKAMSHNSAITNTSTPEEKAKELDNERLALWLKSYEMIKKHPVVGVGMGNWQIYFPDASLKGIWRAEDLNFTFQRPHNDWLWILSETGWLGLNLFFVFIFSVLLFLIRIIRSVSIPPQARTEVILCIAFVVGYFTISFFDFPKERMEHLLWSNIILAFGYFQVKKHSDIKIFKIITAPRTILLCGTGVILLISAIGILRYRGEYYTIKMYNQRAQKQDLPAIHAGYEALSFVYSIDPTSVPIHWYTANSYANLKDYTKAQQDFISAYKANPYNRNVLNDLGSSYAFTNNSALAKKYYEEALRISPRFDDPKLNLAAIYIQEKNWGKADTCLQTMFKDSERRTQYQKMVDAFKPR